MSDKKQKPDEQIDDIAVDEQNPEDETIVISSEDENQNEVDEYKEIAQRIQAEFDNYRKRNNESVKVARNDGINDVICALFDIIDNLERGISLVKEEKAKNGMELIYKQMMALLTKFDVMEIEALDCEFNPNFHHAIAQCENSEKSNIVVEVYQKGYKRKDKVLRPSLVKVAQ